MHQGDLRLLLIQLRLSDAFLHVRVWPPEAYGLFYVYDLLDGLIGSFPIPPLSCPRLASVRGHHPLCVV